MGDIFFMKVTSVLSASDSEPRGLRFRGGEHPPPQKKTILKAPLVPSLGLGLRKSIQGDLSFLLDSVGLIENNASHKCYFNFPNSNI